jgi:hypothetical protein
MTRYALLFAAALAAACGRDPAIPANAQDLSMEQVGFSRTYHSSQFLERTRTVIRDQQTWAEAWAKIGAENAVPEVDFETQMVVLAAMGERPDGRSSIAFDDIAATQDTLYVSVTESTVSGSGCAFVEMVVEPVTLARVQRVDGDVQFIEHTQTKGCF